jgi:simple sugar transport system ATP-binding protein
MAQSSQDQAPVLALKGITKRFPGVLANDHIDLDLCTGEIHALLGENGAGKSTLMNILYGLYQPDEGEIWVRGQQVHMSSPGDAIAAGIGMVHQHFMLIPVFTVTENVMLGEEALHAGGVLDRRSVAARIREISTQYGLNVDPDALVGDLPVGVQQRVEIIKLLYRQADILIFDEPTAVLTPQEADSLFEIMGQLKAQGKAIILITHKLREVLEYADRITVIRRGAVVGHTVPAQADNEKLAEMMVGRAVQLELEHEPARPRDVVLQVRDLQVLSDHAGLAVKGISLDVRAGEIVGLAGVQGNGQTELVEAITGLREIVEGEIRLLGKDITGSPPRHIIEQGVAHIPEDRQRDGLVLSFPIYDNLILQTYYNAPFSKGVVMQEPAIREHAQRLVEQFDVRTPGIDVPASGLSGGNQQKVIVAREFTREIQLLVAVQPTRGLDVGSIEYIHNQLLLKRDAGCAVLLVSTELDEIMQLSGRIAVMYDGHITAVVDVADVTKEQVGLLMAGGTVTGVNA